MTQQLYMYDGKNWTNYDSLGGGSTGILALAADSSGNVWIGNANGLVKFTTGQHSERIDMHTIDTSLECDLFESCGTSSIRRSGLCGFRRFHWRSFRNDGTFQWYSAENSGIIRKVDSQIESFAEDTGPDIFGLPPTMKECTNNSMTEHGSCLLHRILRCLTPLISTSSPIQKVVYGLRQTLVRRIGTGQHGKHSLQQTYPLESMRVLSTPRAECGLALNGSTRPSVFDGSNWTNFTEAKLEDRGSLDFGPR